MKNRNLLIILITCAFIAINFSAEANNAERVVKKSFTNAKEIAINSSYGNIIVREWNKKGIEIEVRIKASSKKSQTEADDFVNSITVNLDQKGDIVLGETSFQKGKSWNNIDSELNIYVYTPANVFLRADNKYGYVDVDKVRKASIDVRYGKITCGTLLEPSKLSVSYGQLNVTNASDLNIDIKYSRLFITACKNIVLVSKYSKVELGSIGRLSMDSKYDNVTIDKTADVVIATSYTPLNITFLEGDANITNKYNNVNIMGVGQKAKRISITNSYSGINVNLTGKKYDITARTSYSKISLPKNVDLKTSIVEKNSEYMQGASGKGDLKVTLTNSYGKITVE